MYNILEKLISRTYYDTELEARFKVDVFYACNRITREEYTNLCVLIRESYKK